MGQPRILVRTKGCNNSGNGSETGVKKVLSLDKERDTIVSP